jgi:1-aminocyclopropane-1-carboxylate deaminase/D-cysteine desulfhydrase-like pyridoxal-dependent ACC family enzyme
MSAVTGVVFLARTVSKSVGLAEPTEEQLKEEMPEKNCALFRKFPHLSRKLAWRSLGASKSTPVHVCTLPKNMKFYVKREDLISPLYGGNKVRSLQHQLAVLEARRVRGDAAAKQIMAVGSGGSNQVVATVVHAQTLGWNENSKDCAINACWLDADEPDLDNTLNYLSVLSFPNVGFTVDWGASPGLLRALKAIRGAFTQNEFIPLMLGGNCPSGVIGQASGIIELAEQIERGDSPDIDRIYVPMGSGCTVSGLILGVVLVRHLNMKAFSSPDFKIVGCNVVDKLALLDRTVGFHISSRFAFMPLTIIHSVLGACWALKQLGGPDLERKCRQFLETNVELRSDTDVVGKYGTHSGRSREAALYYDENGVMTSFKTGRQEKELWVCGHFVAKAFQPLVNDLEEAMEKRSSEEAPIYMLWQTKSAVQPKGPLNEWEKMKQQNHTVKKWANDGMAESPKYRPGKVSTKDGGPQDYRFLMTEIQ